MLIEINSFLNWIQYDNDNVNENQIDDFISIFLKFFSIDINEYFHEIVVDEFRDFDNVLIQLWNVMQKYKLIT